MSTCGQLATKLDEEMLLQRLIDIAAPNTTDGELISPYSTYKKDGPRVFDELGGRFLLKYLRPEQVGAFTGEDATARGLHYTTPTPYAPDDEMVLHLTSPFVRVPRLYVLVLDPRRIDLICGPRRVHWGHGVEYLLPDAFPQEAIAVPNLDSRFRWELAVA